ncbi:MAG TPA: bile acid:sodium symporter, partial [Acetobacteraceae bacterium]|nr:bile acid:sodium symporter [Acetobacteraceae bacterium]
MRKLAQFLPDGFTLSILAVVILGAFFPCSGEVARWVGIVSKGAIALLFFLQGARLSRAAVLAGILHWRLHLVIFAATFIAFPLLGLALGPVSGALIAPPLYVGLLFLCTLPSTVQASVIFTSIAGGNVAAALCSASLSSIIGMVLTPLLIGLLLQAHGESSLSGIVSIALQVLVPFVAGQVAQRRLEPWMKRNQKTVRRVDLGSILLMVYGAISAATLSGMWRLLPV